MSVPVQITFRKMPKSEVVEGRIRELADKLVSRHPGVRNCRVVIELPHKHHQHGQQFQVHVAALTDHGSVAVGPAPGRRQTHDDVYVAARDSFDALERKVSALAERAHDYRQT